MRTKKHVAGRASTGRDYRCGKAPEVMGLSGARAQVGALVDAQETDGVTLAAAFGHLAKLNKAAGSGTTVSGIPRQLKCAPPPHPLCHCAFCRHLCCLPCCLPGRLAVVCRPLWATL